MCTKTWFQLFQSSLSKFVRTPKGCQLIPTDMDHHMTHLLTFSAAISLNHECTDGFIAHVVDDSHLHNATVELTVSRQVASSKWQSSCGLGFRFFLWASSVLSSSSKILLVCGKLLDVCASRAQHLHHSEWCSCSRRTVTLTTGCVVVVLVSFRQPPRDLRLYDHLQNQPCSPTHGVTSSPSTLP